MTRDGRSETSLPDSGSPFERAESGFPEERPVDDFGVNAGAVEELRERFSIDPRSVHPSWAHHFGDGGDRSRQIPVSTRRAAESFSPQLADRHARVLRLIHSYRARGHRIARSDPLCEQPPYFPELDPAHYGFGDDDLTREYMAGDLPGGPMQTLHQILERLRNTYCRSIGVEYTHVQDPGRKDWLRRRMEESENSPCLSAD